MDTGAGWLVPDGDSTTSAKAAAAVQTLMLQLLNGTVDDHGASISIVGSTGGNDGGSINSVVQDGTVSDGVMANAEPPISPGELAALQKSADRCELPRGKKTGVRAVG